MMFKYIAVVKPPTDFSGFRALFSAKHSAWPVFLSSAVPTPLASVSTANGKPQPPTPSVVPVASSCKDSYSEESSDSWRTPDNDSVWTKNIAQPTGDMGLRKRGAEQLSDSPVSQSKRSEPQKQPDKFGFSGLVQAECPSIYPEMPDALQPFFDFGPASPVRGADILAQASLEHCSILQDNVQYSFSHPRFGNIRVDVNLQKELARGAQGTVFPATIQNGERVWPIVYKRYHPGYEEAVLHRLVGAFEILKKLNKDAPHPNIAKPIFMHNFNCGQAVDTVVYTEARIEFSNIVDHEIHQSLKRNSEVGGAFVFKLLVQILELNRFMHAKGFVHNDLKGANLLLDKGHKAHVKATDFELAKQIGDKVPVFTTPVYCGEKQLQQLDGYTVGPDADLNAVGLMLYKWLENQHLYEKAGALSCRQLHAVAKVLQESGYKNARQALKLKGEQDTVLAPLYRIADALISAGGASEETPSLYRQVMDEMAKYVTRYSVTPDQVNQLVAVYQARCTLPA